jgi:small subunit ribosomal protein S2
MAKYKLPKIDELLDAGVHFGHQVKRWHPKMEKYIFGVRKNIHIIDLEQTESKLKEACDFLYEQAKNGGQVILVGTKRQARDVIEFEAKRSGALYVTERWIGGTLTNFKVIKKNIDKFVSFNKRKAEGDLERYTKKERLLIDIELEKLQRNIGGIVNMKGTPAALFVVDARRERTAIREAKRAGVKVVALIDTNSDPTGVDYVIPGNDDAIKSIAAVLKSISDAIEEGYKEFAKSTEKAVKEPEVKKEEKAETEETAKEAKSAKVSTDKSPVVTDDPSIEQAAEQAEAIEEEK